jgi:serine protease Do
LKYAMRAALDAHRRHDAGQPIPSRQPPLYIEQLAAARNYRGCIHCHQAKEIRRDDLVALGKWDRNEVWAYPLPENIGLSLEIDRGNVVRKVMSSSPAARAGIQAGDILGRLNGYPIHSFADAQYALHKAPVQGRIAVSWRRGGRQQRATLQRATLELAAGWRKTNITWRPSLLALLPSLPLRGVDLNADDRQLHSIGPRQLAIRMEKPVHSELREAGIREDDIIIGIDNQRPDMTMDQFLAYIRQNYLAGDRIMLRVLRNGKRLNLTMKLR